MRLLEVLYSFRVGGSETVGLELAASLKNRGVDVTCASLEGPNGPLVERCRLYGIPVVDLEIPTTSFLGRNGLSLRVMRNLRSLRLDVLHMHHSVAMNKLVLAARTAGIPRIVMTEHSTKPLDTEALARWRFRALRPLTSLITVVDPSIRDWFVSQLRCPADAIRVIQNGINVANWHRRDRPECRQALGIADQVVFVFVGRLERVKRVPELIQAFLNVVERSGTNAMLLVVGGGSESAACADVVAARRGAAHVKLVGEQQDVRPYLAAGDAFVMNSSSEGMPRALLEAMYVGLACVAPDVGGIKDVLSGRGWVFDALSSHSLEAAITAVAAGGAEVQSRCQRASTYVAEHFDQDVTTRAYLECFGTR